MNFDEVMGFSNRVATQKDVARVACVSQATVSTVLTGKTRKSAVSAKTRERIIHVARVMNYRPNLSARVIRSRRFFNLGYFVANAEGQFAFDFPEFAAGIYDAATERDYHVLMVRLPYQLWKDGDPVPKVFRESHLDALIVHPVSRLSPDIHDATASGGLPVVHLNDRQTHNSVCLDDYEGASVMTRYLVNQGYRRIAFFKTGLGFDGHYSVKDRIEGYSRVMKKHRLKPEVKLVGSDFERETLEWLSGPNRPEAVFCYQDADALRLEQVAHKARLRIPHDLALAGYNDDWWRQFSGVPMTTMQVPRYRMAMEAVHMALRIVETKNQRQENVVFKPTLLTCESTRRSS